MSHRLAETALDLEDVGVIDRDVMSFFGRCEADGVQLENCPSYIRMDAKRKRLRGRSAGR